MRVFYIVLANLALPFLLFYLRNAMYKAYYILVEKNKDKQVPKLDKALAFKLLCCGIILLGCVLAYMRFQQPVDIREHSLQVQEYNFR